MIECVENGDYIKVSELDEMRKLLWLRHGHQGLYGDDGEMQCGKCLPHYDYKRGDILVLLGKVLDVLQGEIFRLGMDKILFEAETVRLKEELELERSKK